MSRPPQFVPPMLPEAPRGTIVRRGLIALAGATLIGALVVVAVVWPRNPADAGARLLTQGLYRTAVPLLLRAVTIRPNDAAAHHNLGLAYAHIGWQSAAISQLKMAVSLVPSSAEFHEDLGCAQREAGDDAAAMKEFEETARLRPGSGENQRLLSGTACPPMADAGVGRLGR